MSVLNRMKLYVYSAERTGFAQELVDQMGKVEQLFKQAKQLIDRVRCNTQPNKAHRSDDSLLPDDDENNERLRYSASMRELAGTQAFADPGHAVFLKKLADVHDAIEKAHAKFLRQVQVFCVKELRKFTNETYPFIKQAYTELEKRRDAYDLARHKLKSCKGEEVDIKGEVAINAQKAFEQQAVALFDILQKMPEHEKGLTKALYMYTRAELDYSKETLELLKAVKAPETMLKPTSPKSACKN